MKYKSALITGCSSGIGYLTALTFARAGYKTFATVKNLQSEGAEKLSYIAIKEKLPLEVFELDITKQHNIDHLFEKLSNQKKTIDILINNAGIGNFGPVEDYAIDEITKIFDVNFYGAVRMMRGILPQMRQRKRGLIINVSSILGLIGLPLQGIYSASKHALENYSETLSYEVKKFGINVVIIEPGKMQTNFTQNRLMAKEYSHLKSPYAKLLEHFMRKVNRRHDFFTARHDPQHVADLILNVSYNSDPYLRYLIGTDANLLASIRMLLPQKLWTYVVRKMYNW